MESAFQFTNPVLIGFEYGINEEFVGTEDEIETQINMSVQVDKSEDSNEARVKLKVEFGEKGERNPFFFVATEAAKFRWENSLDDKMIDKLLNQNAPSLLLSYLRPIVAQITTSSPFETVNIPFMNFTKPD